MKTLAGMIVGCCLVMLCFLPSLDRAQAFSWQMTNRVLSWSPSPIGSNNEKAGPGLQISRQIVDVEVVQFLVEGREINISEGFSAPDDFLLKMTFKVKNVSHRLMTRIQLTLVVPDDKESHSPQIIYCYGCREKEQEHPIAPGDVVELKMSAQIYDFVMRRLEEKGIKVVERVEVSHMYVWFPEGPTLFSGCVRTTSPRNACF